MKFALKRGLIAVLLSEVFFLAMSFFIANDPLEVITSYSRYNQREWLIRLLVALGAFAVGLVNGTLKIPVWLLILGMAFIPCAILWMSMDQLSKPSEIQVLYTPLSTTIAAATPTLFYLAFRILSKIAPRTRAQ
ncbi:MAG: hypothetical protein ACT4QE_05480 [Anaerolineales bacterium]